MGPPWPLLLQRLQGRVRGQCILLGRLRAVHKQQQAAPALQMAQQAAVLQAITLFLLFVLLAGLCR